MAEVTAVQAASNKTSHVGLAFTGKVLLTLLFTATTTLLVWAFSTTWKGIPLRYDVVVSHDIPVGQGIPIKEGYATLPGISVAIPPDREIYLPAEDFSRVHFREVYLHRRNYTFFFQGVSTEAPILFWWSLTAEDTMRIHQEHGGDPILVSYALRGNKIDLHYHNDYASLRSFSIFLGLLACASLFLAIGAGRRAYKIARGH